MKLGSQQENERYKRNKKKALIPFATELDEKNQRIMIEKNVLVKNKCQKVTYCELNYTTNMSR